MQEQTSCALMAMHKQQAKKNQEIIQFFISGQSYKTPKGYKRSVLLQQQTEFIQTFCTNPWMKYMCINMCKIQTYMVDVIYIAQMFKRNHIL